MPRTYTPRPYRKGFEPGPVSEAPPLYVDGSLCPSLYAPLWHHVRNLSYTASGYGRRIPTERVVYFRNRWRRVYVCIFSNIGTCYIGPSIRAGHVVTN